MRRKRKHSLISAETEGLALVEFLALKGFRNTAVLRLWLPLHYTRQNLSPEFQERLRLTKCCYNANRLHSRTYRVVPGLAGSAALDWVTK